MSGLKKFLHNRSKGLAEKRNKIEETVENKVSVNNDDMNLTDDEFWEISNTFLKESKKSDDDPAHILQNILSHYSPKKIEQFAKRYQELNK